jgi:methyl-accepting chemotaxis protein
MLKRLKIWQKFTLIALAFSIPIVVLAVFLLRETQKVVSFSTAEIDGTEYFRPLRKLVMDVSAHRDLHSAILAGDASFKAELDKKAEEIEAGFKALEAVDAKYSWQFALTADLNEVRSRWQALRGNAAGMTLDKSFEEHNRYIRTLLQFSYLLGNSSNLILDPDVESYYLVDSIIFKIPKVAEEISRARAIAAAYLVSGGQGEENSLRRGELAGAVVRIEDALQQQDYFSGFARRRDERIDQALAAALNENKKAVTAFTALLADKIINSTGDLMSVKDFMAAAAAPLGESTKLWDATVVELNRLLSMRIATLNRERFTQIAAVGVALVLSMLLLFVVVRAITRPIAHLRDVADKISLGDMDAVIQVDTRDEIGDLGDSFRRLQVSLREAMDAIERQSEAQGG